MIIGTIKEKKKFENRVAISPDEAKNYIKSGHQVLIEKNAGLLSGFTDKSYKEAGATISSSKEILKTSDIIVKINCPSSDEAKQLKSSSMVISQLNVQNEADTIKIFNKGLHKRDFTFIDDIIQGLILAIDKIPYGNSEWLGDNPDPSSSKAPWKVYNLGNNKPIDLMKYINELENAFGLKAKKEFLPLQDGDMPDTWANIDSFVEDFNYNPKTTIQEGISEFVKWFKDYYNL